MPVLTALALAGLVALQSPKPSAPPKLISKDVVVGTGAKVVRGDQIFVDYSGTFLNGKVFDATKAGQPFIVLIGMGFVIPGWDQGMVGMRVGGVRTLVIPPSLAYGPADNGPIPGNSTLKFKVKLIKFVHTQARIKTTVETPGKGAGATWQETVKLKYTGSLPNGTEFDSNVKRADTLDVTLGQTKLIPGFTLGLLGIKVGETRTIKIPADLGYGGRAVGPIPANSDLVFKITRQS